MFNSEEEKFGLAETSREKVSLLESKRWSNRSRIVSTALSVKEQRTDLSIMEDDSHGKSEVCLRLKENLPPGIIHPLQVVTSADLTVAYLRGNFA